MHQAYQVVYDLLQQQAASLASVDAFQMLTLVCLISLPCVFLLRNVQPKGASAVAH
jgi:hypothetical protein